MISKATVNLVRHCMSIYDVNSVTKLAEVTEIPYTTLIVWENKGPSTIGKLLLQSLIENIEMKRNLALLIQAEDTKVSATNELRKLLQISS